MEDFSNCFNKISEELVNYEKQCANKNENDILSNI